MVSCSVWVSGEYTHSKLYHLPWTVSCLEFSQFPGGHWESDIYIYIYMFKKIQSQRVLLQYERYFSFFLILSLRATNLHAFSMWLRCTNNFPFPKLEQACARYIEKGHTEDWRVHSSSCLAFFLPICRASIFSVVSYYLSQGHGFHLLTL